VLHIATHGFYLPEQPAADDGGPTIPSARHEHPAGELGLPSLRRSGVLLAGANRTAVGRSLPPGDDGWLTAEEIALMSLRGTELVVLSACETGLGDVQSGEGVYGLRRAFLYAGAHSLVVSLFKVPDAETQELMRGFYQRLNAGKGRLTALHDAKREAIAQRRAAGGAAHPFYWASFILVGSAD
jgi:CHAT domain-containing protein